MRELFLISCRGIHYGVWKDEILSVRDIDALHRIPFSPACIAGIMIDDGQTVTLADLPVCIGYESSPAIGQGRILLMAEGEKVTGFVVSGGISTQSIPPESLFPLPDYLKTPVFDSCAIHHGIPIPLINVAELYSRVLKADEEPSVDSLWISAAQAQDVSGIAKLRFFAAGGELYAVSAAGMDDNAVKPGPVTPLPNTPQHVQGVTFWNGRLLPVIDLSQRIKRQSGAPESVMLIADIGGTAFGLLIDRDGGTYSADEVEIKPVPLIARTSWLKHMVVRAGELIPLVDLAMALSPGPGAADEKPIWQRYAPGSGFPALFFKHDVDVVEFSLLGVRHALPKQEVEDVIAFKPCRALPDVPPIVIGVAEHHGEILPVVDLAMMFGRRSLSTPEWRMMLVNNGDFRALVITEAVFGERRLALEIQRAVPIQLPHDLMYGCYPDDKAVRLILNIEAISVHFEKSLIKKFLPALSHQMKKMSAEIEAAPAVASAAVLSTAGSEDLAMQEQASGHQGADEPAPELQQQAEEEYVEFIEVQEAATAARAIAPESEQMDAVLAAVSSASTQESLVTKDEWGGNEAHEQEPVPSAEAVSENMMEPETMTAAAEPSELAAALHSVSAREPSGEGSKAREPLVMSAPPPGEKFIAPSRKEPSQKVSAAAASARPGRPYRTYDEESSVWKRRSAYGALAAVLVAVFYFAGTSDKPGVEKSAKVTEPAKPEQAKVRTEPVKTQAELAKEQAEQAKQQASQAKAQAKAEREAKLKAEQVLVLSQEDKAQTEPPRPAEKLRAPLEINIPKNMPVDIDVYVVVKDDTLWSISQRFTGNPYNYPRIAGENRIADPDLIFPGQRIRLIK